MKRTKENTVLIYWEGTQAYLRIAPIETPRFRHGISLASTIAVESFEIENYRAVSPKDRDEKMNKAKEKAEAFREDVWQYLKEAFNL